MDNEKENLLIHAEKPYYTEDELRLYYQIAIDEALKQGNKPMAEHYKMLLSYLDSNKNNKTLYDMIVEQANNKKNKK